MTSKMFCPFYNVGFCKFKDNCSKEHADEDCQHKCARTEIVLIDIEGLANMARGANIRTEILVSSFKSPQMRNMWP